MKRSMSQRLGLLPTLFTVLWLTGCTKEVPPANGSLAVPPPATNALPALNDGKPTWYVFKVKEIRSFKQSDDKTFALVEGVTIQDKEFKIKVVWNPAFGDVQRKSFEIWNAKSPTEFAIGVPYIIAGKVLSREPLTIQPDTLAPKGTNFGAPEENIY